MSSLPANEYRLLEQLEAQLQGASAEDIVRAMVCDMFPGRIAAVSAFGPESAVLLHMIALADRSTPVLFLDTEKHFPETESYRDLLIDRLRLTDVRIIRPDAAELMAHDPAGDLATHDPSGCPGTECRRRRRRPSR